MRYGFALLAACLASLVPAWAEPVVSADPALQALPDYQSLDREIQVLKKEILELNRDIRLLEEAVLYPAERQLVVFVSLAKHPPVRLERVTLRLGGELLRQHEYRAEELSALREGGVQRLYQGRLETGSHYLEIALTGLKPDGEAFALRRIAKLTQRSAPRYVELQLAGEGEAPELTIYTW